MVVDSSVFLALALGETHDGRTDEMERSLSAYGAVVPAVWIYEVETALLCAQRAGRISVEDVNVALDAARQGFFTVDSVGPSVRFGAEIAIARAWDLSAYDAAYLELAQRRNLPLMTLDRRLEKAAHGMRLAWHPGYSPLVVPRRGRRAAVR